MKAKDLIRELENLPYDTIMEEMVKKFKERGVGYVHRVGNPVLYKIEDIMARFRADGYIVSDPTYDKRLGKYMIEISLSYRSR